jgi:hypothetical protein
LFPRAPSMERRLFFLFLWIQSTEHQACHLGYNRDQWCHGCIQWVCIYSVVIIQNLVSFIII